MGEKHKGGYSGVFFDRMAERVYVGIQECSHDEIIYTGISVMIYILVVDMNCMDMDIFAYLRCGGDVAIRGINTRISWVWE